MMNDLSQICKEYFLRIIVPYTKIDIDYDFPFKKIVIDIK